MDIVVATRNPDKLALIGSLLPAGMMLRALPSGDDVAEPEPIAGASADGLVSIAAAKAIASSVRADGTVAIATDGGLVVPALPDWVPARTRRFAGPGMTNADRAAALLALAAGLRGDGRRIAWREAVAVARGGQIVLSARAESAPGWLATTLPDQMVVGADGFWVPWLWLDAPDGVRVPGAGQDHWPRLAAIVRPFLAGSDSS